jgi:hypothetical protein
MGSGKLGGSAKSTIFRIIDGGEGAVAAREEGGIE